MTRISLGLTMTLALGACRATTLGNEETGMSLRRALAKQTARTGKPAALDAEDATRTMAQQHLPLDREQAKQQLNLLKY